MNALRFVLLASVFAPSAFAHPKGHAEHRWDQDARAFQAYREEFSLPQTSLPQTSSRSTLRTPIERIDAAYLEESLRILAGEKDATMANRKAAAGRAAARAEFGSSLSTKKSSGSSDPKPMCARSTRPNALRSSGISRSRCSDTTRKKTESST